ncbi:MAG TPA: acyltransferase [Xanthobacteraceae bacterium]
MSEELRTSGRLHRSDLDALRVFACGGVILLHVLLIFAAEPSFPLKDAVVSPTATVLAEFLRITTMPLFFVIAGWSAVVSLRGRGAGSFVRKRVTRLLVPLIVGSALFGSIIRYIELTHNHDTGFHGFHVVEALQIGFFTFFPRNLMRMNQVTWSHLWFLAYLFLISLMLLPLLMRLARCAPRTQVAAAPTVFIPALALAALLATLGGYWPYMPNLITDGANLAYYALCFAFGAGIAAWPGFETRLRTEAAWLLAVMVLGFAGVMFCGETTAGRLFVGLTAWGAVGAGLGFAARFNPPATPLLAYLSDAALPVYILHLVPVLLLGIVIAPLALPVGLKIALIFLSGTLVTLAVYRWLIRPWAPMRWLMGMGGESGHAASGWSAGRVFTAGAAFWRGTFAGAAGTAPVPIGAAGASPDPLRPKTP